VSQAGKVQSNPTVYRGQAFPERLQEVFLGRGYRENRTLLVETYHVRGYVLPLAAREGSVHATAGEVHASITTMSHNVRRQLMAPPPAAHFSALANASSTVLVGFERQKSFTLSVNSVMAFASIIRLFLFPAK
jgi:hypothetical protein